MTFSKLLGLVEPKFYDKHKNKKENIKKLHKTWVGWWGNPISLEGGVILL